MDAREQKGLEIAAKARIEQQGDRWYVPSQSGRIGSHGNRYEVTGKMTIKGRTKDVTAPFTFKPEGPGGTFDGAFTLKRLDYAIGEGAWADTDTVANEVQVKFRISGTSGR